jgi:Sec-independent protein translocase protein TatA
MLFLLFGVVILVGGKKLPELGRCLGKGISEFKKGIGSLKEEKPELAPEEGGPKSDSTKPGDAAF